MKKPPRALVLLIAVGLIPAAAASSAGGAAGALKTRGYVQHLAADGNRVAAATNGLSHRCDRIVVWNPVRKALAGINTAVSCPGNEGAVNDVPQVAIAGKRVSWLEAVGGNNLDLAVKSKLLTGNTKVKTVSTFAENGYGAGETADGDWIGNLAGHGSLTVYNYWSLCTAIPAGSEDDTATCKQPAAGSVRTVTFSGQELRKISANGSVEIATAADATIPASEDKIGTTMSLAVVSVDADRIATQDPSGLVTVYSANGDQLTQIAVPAGSFAGTVLQGSQLVTLRDGNLELYDANTGTLTSTTPLAADAVLRDLHNGLAVYIVGRKVHVLRLEDGKDIAYAPLGKGVVDAQIASSGLYYSYNFPGGLDHGRVAFVSFAKVLQKLG